MGGCWSETRNSCVSEIMDTPPTKTNKGPELSKGGRSCWKELVFGVPFTVTSCKDGQMMKGSFK